MKIYLLVLCLLYSTLSIGQTFNKRIIDTSQVAAMDFAKLFVIGDTLITIGRGAILEPPLYPAKIMVSKFDISTGEMFSNLKIYGNDTLTEFTPYIGECADVKGNQLLITGGVGSSILDKGGFVTLVEDYDTSLWLNTYDPPNSSYWQYTYYRAKIISDNQFLFLVYSQADGSANSYSTATKLICTDSLGEIQWEKDYESDIAKYHPGCLYEDSDSTLLLGLRISSGFGDPETISHRSTIYRINHEGEVLAEWQNDNDSTYAPRKILRTPDGGFVFVGRYFDGISDLIDLPVWQGYICKLNSELEKEWELKLAESSYYTTFYSMVQTADGNFIATGNSLKYLENGLQKQHGWLVKFNEEGDIIWERKILSGSEWYSQITDIAELPDGGLVACGLSQAENEDYPQRGWLLRMDEYGCFDGEPCDTIVSVGDFTIIPQPLVEVMPNPAHDYFEVQTSDQQPLEHIIIYSALGQQVWSATNIKQQKIEVPCQNWPRGTYFVNVNNQWSGRVVLSD